VFAAFGIMHRQHRRCIIPQSIAPEDGRNYLPKHVELIEIIDKLLLLHLVGCLSHCITDARSHKYQTEIYENFDKQFFAGNTSHTDGQMDGRTSNPH